MNKTFLISAVIVIAIGGFIYWEYNTAQNIACPADAKICPDGTAVGRIGPHCEFGVCSNENTYANWQTAENKEMGILFQYPPSLTTTYIHAETIPPIVTVTTDNFSCEEAAAGAAPNGITEIRTIQGRIYCVQSISEGAAGSTYTTANYTTQKDNRLITVSMTIRAVQCGNYDNPEKAVCMIERESFSLDTIMHQIVESVRFI